MEVLIGSYTDYNKDTQLYGAVEKAIKNNANCIMFYTGDPKGFQRNEIDLNITKEAHVLMNKNNINSSNIFIHAPFILNIANDTDKRKYNFYINYIRDEIVRCKKLGLENIILHPGNSVKLSKETALNNIVSYLKIILKENSDVNILIEFMSGKGTEMCSTIEEFEYIFNFIKNENLGVCLDTCHLNDSGVDLNCFDDFLDVFDSKIGIDKIKCIHINDSFNEMGSHKDRHANIGYGKIGFETLIDVIYNSKIKDVPKILETPVIKSGEFKELTPYKFEIDSILNKEFVDFIK